MRIAALIILLLVPSTTSAGFTITGWYVDSPRASLESVEQAEWSVPKIASGTLEENLRGAYVQLSNQYSDIIGGAVSFLATQFRGIRSGVPTVMGELHFLISAPKTKECFDPTRLKLDISFDINGNDMGGLSSISGMPIGNGRQGIVRIQGMDGMLLVENFEPQPYIAVQTGEMPGREEPVLMYAQEIVCLFFVAAAFLSTVVNSQQMEQQRLRARAQAIASQAAPTVAS